MRITESMITKSLLSNINRNRETMHSIQESISTGKEVEKSSDNPVQFYRANRFRQSIKLNDQFLENIRDAKSWMQETSSNLDGLLNQVMVLKQKAIQGADDSLNEDNRKHIALDVEHIIQDLVNISNGSFMDKNLFSGTRTKIGQSFEYEKGGSSVDYKGNGDTIYRRISENFNVRINVSGLDIKESKIFEEAIKLRDALESNDTNGISDCIESIDSVKEVMISLNAANGSIQQQLDMAENRLNTANLNLSGFLSETEDVNLAEAITKYNSEEIAYQAALQSSSDILKLNIMDFLR